MKWCSSLPQLLIDAVVFTVQFCLQAKHILVCHSSLNVDLFSVYKETSLQENCNQVTLKGKLYFSL